MDESPGFFLSCPRPRLFERVAMSDKVDARTHQSAATSRAYDQSVMSFNDG
jgi:hypothetical protein